MFYQKKFKTDRFGNDILFYSADAKIPLHLHRVAELIVVEKGCLTLQYRHGTEQIMAGQCAMILPNCLHAFCISSDGGAWVHTFPVSVVPQFFRVMGNRTAESAGFVAVAEAINYYRWVCLRRPPETEETSTTKSVLRSWLPEGIPVTRLKAALYGMLDCFLEQVSLINRNKADDALFIQIVTYISEHCTEDITLQSVADHFGYEPHYLSRYMKSVADIHFRHLVNSYRMDNARLLLENTERPITEIAVASGYDCLRTFNRVFREVEGRTPTAFRQQSKR